MFPSFGADIFRRSTRMPRSTPAMWIWRCAARAKRHSASCSARCAGNEIQSVRDFPSRNFRPARPQCPNGRCVRPTISRGSPIIGSDLTNVLAAHVPRPPHGRSPGEYRLSVPLPVLRSRADFRWSSEDRGSGAHRRRPQPPAKDYGIDAVQFYDNNFFLNESHAREQAELLIPLRLRGGPKAASTPFCAIRTTRCGRSGAPARP